MIRVQVWLSFFERRVPVSYTHLCIEVGFDIKSLSEILGHANVNITLNRYVHPPLQLKKENMERLSVFAVK